jgi:hypothetical protein
MEKWHGNRRHENAQIVTYKEIINQYYNRCKRDDIKWGLTDEEAIALFIQDCHYCGHPPMRNRNAYRQRKNRTAKEWHKTAEVQYNGIDRIDSNQDYHAANVVTACFICNRAKSNMTFQEFTEWIKRIIAHGKTSSS